MGTGDRMISPDALGMNPAMFQNLLRFAPAGPRIEIGVFRGHTLRLIARHHGETIGVDSFEGMAEPTEHDFVDGVTRYPKGRLACPMDRVRQEVPSAVLIKGFVPEILADVPDGPFAFAHVDPDHYAPTVAALEWLDSRMMPGGVLVADDYFPNLDALASKAIKEFAAKRPIADANGRKCWWVY